MILARVREFYREPEALFWVYGFPILIVVALGFAFRNQPVEVRNIDVQSDLAHQTEVEFVINALKADPRFVVAEYEEAAWHKRLRSGRTDLVVIATSSGRRYEYEFDPTREKSKLARTEVEDTLQRAAGRKDILSDSDNTYNEVGGRYIDFLVPGLLGMSLMGGGLWGVGFATVDLRIRKVLKRFLATPMRKSDFLAAILVSRLLFLIPEVFVLLLFARLAFGVVIQGSLFSIVVLILLGALTFAGIGLLVASRATTLETVSGLMNLVMLPMWVLSGIFFSSERFPAQVQPFINALPLTPLIQALRHVSQDGDSLLSQWPQLSILAAWASGSFLLALRWFRWN
jgi:ABC-type multidrug transport system permease subunit